MTVSDPKRVKIISEADWPVRILIPTTFDADEYVYKALQTGANGFVLKDIPSEELALAIRTVAEGGALLSPSITKRLIGAASTTSDTDEISRITHMLAIALGVVLLVLSGLLWTLNARIVAGRLGPNRWVGIRTAVTRESDTAWLAAHQAASPLLKLTAIVGWITAVTTIVSRSLGLFLAGCLAMVLMSSVAKIIGVRAAGRP